MRPSIECLELRNEKYGKHNFIAVQLTDSSPDLEPFKIEAFEELVKKSMHPEYGQYGLKYIVQGDGQNDRMFVFMFTLGHDRAWELLKDNGMGRDEELRSAGLMGLLVDQGSIFSRSIDGCSDTLCNLGLISDIDSDNYKYSVIKEKFGPWFGIS